LSAPGEKLLAVGKERLPAGMDPAVRRSMSHRHVGSDNHGTHGCRAGPVRAMNLRAMNVRAMKKKLEIDVAALIGRIGPEAAIVLRSRKAGPMADRRTRRYRSRGDRKRKAIAEE
jgi:hypothetical protein